MRRILAVLLAPLLLASTVLGCGGGAPPPATPPDTSPPVFLKGQLHAHTGRSGDSSTPPAEAVAWYAQHGFDFVVLTDHNHITGADAPPGMLVFRGVELTQNHRTCVPPPRPREACLLHVNALFVTRGDTWQTFSMPASRARTDIYGQAIDRALALGGLAQLNHPNFHGGADLDVLLAAVKRGATLVEIANQTVDAANEGDRERLSTEALWDAALVRGARVFATATDDAHHYDDAPFVRARGEVAYTGDRGFVMVRAQRTGQSIRNALATGDFYASTGVVLDRLEMTPSAVVAEIRTDGLPPYVFEVIANGRVVQRTEGASLRFDPRPFGPGYVRVRVTAGRRRAWTQPVWLGD